MKERIEKKLEENIERILNKEELDRFDVAILKDELCKIEREEKLKENSEEKKELMESLIKHLI